jgi:hypothetical protein
MFFINYKIYPTTNIWHLIFVLTFFLIQRKMPLKPQNKKVLTFENIPRTKRSSTFKEIVNLNPIVVTKTKN